MDNDSLMNHWTDSLIESAWKTNPSEQPIPEEEVSYLGLLVFLIPLIVFTLYYIYLRSKHKHKIIEWVDRKFPSSFSEFSFREIQTVLAVAMIKRDRHLFMAKRSRIHQFISNNYNGKKLDVDEIIDFFLDGKIPLVDLMEWCNEFAAYEQKLQTFSFLAEIALIDNELIDKEREYLLFVIRKFEIRNQDIPEILQDHLFESSRKKVSAPKVRFYSCFEILELNESASAKEIKEAHRRLVKKYHPDSQPHLSPDEKKQLAERFQQVQEAYNELMSV
ncbi:DnaJ domain-containing protein [Fluviicola sp.]|uniref:DnaJ domain-containing protein n=1 Tax=Fluviicola sp. TaxID=1917219 RepID=UPI003D2CF76A